MRKIAIYSRKSRFTGKGESIGSQVELCRAYISDHMGGGETAVYEDEGFSGGNLNRPGFQAMLGDARAGKLRAVVVYRLDRISRSIGDFSGLIEELSRLRVEFVSIREQFDTTSPMGRAMMYISSVFSQLERETIAERIRDNLHELAKTGRWLGGVTPTGYGSRAVTTVSVDGKRRRACCLVPIPAEEAVVRQIFLLYSKTGSLTGTERELLARGVRSKTGREYSRYALRGILKNPVYAAADRETYRYFREKGAFLSGEEGDFDGLHGLMVYHRTRQEKGRRAEPLPESEWIVAVGAHPPFLTGRAWLAVQARLDRNTDKSCRSARRNQALLTGHIRCACGSRMFPKLTARTAPDGSPVFVYLCKNKERTCGAACALPNPSGNRLDDLVWTEIENLPWERKHAAELLRRGRALFADRAGEEGVDRSLEELRHKLAGLIDRLSDCPPEQVRLVLDRIGTLQEEQRRLEERAARLRREDAPSATPESLCALENLSPEERRTMAARLIDRVEWDGTQARLYWKENGRSPE